MSDTAAAFPSYRYYGAHDAELVWQLYQDGLEVGQIRDAYNDKRQGQPIYNSMVSAILRRLGAFEGRHPADTAKAEARIAALKSRAERGMPLTPGEAEQVRWGLSTRTINALIVMGFSGPDDIPRGSRDFRKLLQDLIRESNAGRVTADEVRRRFPIVEHDMEPASPPKGLRLFRDSELLAELARRLQSAE